jgi:hypothetical protein
VKVGGAAKVRVIGDNIQPIGDDKFEDSKTKVFYQEVFRNILISCAIYRMLTPTTQTGSGEETTN